MEAQAAFNESSLFTLLLFLLNIPIALLLTSVSSSLLRSPPPTGGKAFLAVSGNMHALFAAGMVLRFLYNVYQIAHQPPESLSIEARTDLVGLWLTTHWHLPAVLLVYGLAIMVAMIFYVRRHKPVPSRHGFAR